MLIHLNIGSNQGDRAALLERAVALLVGRLRPVAWRASQPVVSEPWGFDSPHPFLNIGLDIELAEDDAAGLLTSDVRSGLTASQIRRNPELLLDLTQQCERLLGSTPHRNADGSYRDRNIDIDIILIDDLHVSTPRLTVPHPHMHDRSFVIEPLRQLRSR